MVLIYAYGSGIGHLKRVSDFIKHKEIPPSKCIVLTQNGHGDFWENDWKVIRYPREIFAQPKLFKSEFEKLIFEFIVDEIIVDVFPEGFFGELSGLLDNYRGKKTLLARILKDKYFEKFPPTTVYDEAYLLEEGVSPTKYLVKKWITEWLPYFFNDDKLLTVPDQPFYLTIHSQPAEEVINLIRQAELYGSEIPSIIFTNCELPAEFSQRCCVFFGKQPSLSFLQSAEKIFSGTGFNAVRILKDFQDKTEFVPFPRVYDDQFLRKWLMKPSNKY